MRNFFIILLLLLLQKASGQVTLAERMIFWNHSQPYKFENESFFDTIHKYNLICEKIDLHTNIDLQLMFLEWDTISKDTSISYSNIPSAFDYEIFLTNNSDKYTYKFIVTPFCRLKGDSSVVLRLKKYKIYSSMEQKLKSKKSSMNSVLAKGEWRKFKVVKSGIYKLSFSQISEMGFKDPSKVSLFGYAMGMLPKATSEPAINDLIKIPVLMDGDNMYFYGNDANSWSYNKISDIFYHQYNGFSDTTYYFITDQYGSPEQLSDYNYISQNELTEIKSYYDLAFHEKDEININKSGSEWYGDIMTSHQQKILGFSFPDMDPGTKMKIYYDLVNKSTSVGYFTFSIGNENKTISVSSSYVNSDLSGGKGTNNFTMSAPADDISLKLTYSNDNDTRSEGYINYIGLNVKRKLIFRGTPLIIRNSDEIGTGKDLKFIVNTSSSNINIQVWDISDINRPLRINPLKSDQGYSFIVQSDAIRTFIIFNLNDGLLSPIIDKESKTALPNQNIHGSSVPDLIIVSPDSSAIYEQALRLAQFRRNNDGLNVLLVKISEVYNEFSAGRKDVTAIRNMVKYFYEKSLTENNKLSYLLLFGDGSYVNKESFAGNTNLLPSYESTESFNINNSYVTDDYFGWMTYYTKEENCLLNVGIGRIPIKNYLEAKTAIDKLIAYSNPKNDDDWRNILTFIADDGDDNKHLGQSDDLSESIRLKYPYLNVYKIFLDAYTQVKSSNGEAYPDVLNTINNRVNSGALIVNYTGHGNERQLTNESVINLKSIRNWNNKNKLPLFVTATCEFSRWDDVNYAEKKSSTTGGEELFLNDKGGAIALFTTTRLVYADDNSRLNIAFFKYAFEKNDNGTYPKLGDLIRLTKNDPTSSGTNRLNFTLLGDPSLSLAYPKKLYIKTDSINNKPVEVNAITADTLKALSITKISGSFKSDNNTLEAYNGILSVNVLDKPDTLSTLSNDDDSPKYTFVRQGATIYKGLAEVKNGKFSFEFPLPIDIKLNLAHGKIIYYAPSDGGGYAGYYEKIVIGGIDKNMDNSFISPEINLYMNDTNFVDGGITNANPVLLVHLSDNDGINATGIGLGHDISAILDNDFTQFYSLNTNYRTDVNNYKKGFTSYSYYDLTPGQHVLKVTAWDIFNNSLEKELHFNVINNENIEINKVYNYPNPMKNVTYFTFEHNKPDEELTIEVRIYSSTGSLVNILKYKGSYEGFRTSPILWNGENSYGSKVKNGLYPYKVIITPKNGASAQSNGKLVIIK